MKKVNVEAQCLCNPSREIRGIEYVTLELLSMFAKHGKFSFSASFFDYGRERNNRELLEEYFKRYDKNILSVIELHECNTLDYRQIIHGWDKDEIPGYASKWYEEYFDVDADLYYFPQTVTLPANLPKDKTVVTIHDILHIRNDQARKYHPDAAAQIERIIDYISKRKDVKITSVSESTKRDLVEYAGIDENRINVVYEAYNNDLYWPQKNGNILSELKITKPYVLYLGGLDAHKGIDVLCEAFDRIKDKDFQLVLAGGRCTWYDIDPIIGSMSRRKDVVLTGYVTDEQKRVLMSMAEIFVFPSYYEGFGLPVIEAMACGAPVIASDSTSLPEVGGEAAQYFRTGDSESLKELLEKLISDDDLRRRVSEGSLQRAKKFSWDKTAHDLEMIFDEFTTD